MITAIRPKICNALCTASAALAAVVFGCMPPLGLAASVPEGATVQWPLAGLEEPSAIVYHPIRRSFFVVGDEGDIAEVDLQGTLLKQKRIRGDLEAITCDPATGRLYVVREGHEIIFEVDPDTFKLLRRFDLDRTFKGDPDFLQRGGDGIEGLTFVADPAHAEGGRFFAVNQYDPAVLVELHIPLKSSTERFETATVVGAWPVDGAPLSDIAWSARDQAFLIVSALWRSVYVVDSVGEVLRKVRVPGFMQEGLALLPDGSVVIAQDSGGLIRWTPASPPFSPDRNPAAAAHGQEPGKVDSEPSKDTKEDSDRR